MQFVKSNPVYYFEEKNGVDYLKISPKQFPTDLSEQ